MGIVLSSLLGFFFHIWKDGGVWKLLLYLLLSWAGFWGAQLIGDSLGVEFMRVGPLLVGLDLLGSILLLVVGHWLSLVKAEEG